MRGGHRLVQFFLCATVLAASPISASADSGRVTELAKSLSSSSEKTRIAAVAALGRLEDKAALKPLVTALHDPNAQVRAIAAAALGKLGHKAALPALKTAADEDPDDKVKKHAREAAVAVAKSNKLPDPWPKAVAEKSSGIEARRSSKSGGTAGFGRQAHAVETHPDLYVKINSSADDSPGKADKPTRKMHSDILKETLQKSFGSNPMVTMTASDAERWGLDPRHLDLSVTKLDVAQSGVYVEIEAQLRLAISDDNGKMLSFLSGGAKVQVPKRTFNAKYLPNLRREAIENAMRGMFDKLLAHLRDKSQS
ncbi:MAG: HEAT repeat domain-containing protein [Kofleriaceae bacterium]